jgi:AraC-like DNA-binding protein
MDMNTLTCVRFRTLVTRLISACSGPVADPSSRISTIAHLERELFSVILQGQRHNYTRLLHRYSSAGPWQMRAVLEYAHSHAHVPLTLGDLAKVAGVSARTLQHNFQRRFGCGPMQVLRSIRMQSVRDALLNRDETAGVLGFFTFWPLRRRISLQLPRKPFRHASQLPSALSARTVCKRAEAQDSLTPDKFA